MPGSAGTFETAMMMIERKTISIMKACELVGVSRRTIYNWIAGGKVEYVRTAGGSVRIFVDTLWREPARGAAASLARTGRNVPQASRVGPDSSSFTEGQLRLTRINLQTAAVAGGSARWHRAPWPVQPCLSASGGLATGSRQP